MGHWRFRSIDDAVDGEPTIAAVRKAGYVSLVAVLCVVSLVGCGSDQPQRPSVANSRSRRSDGPARDRGCRRWAEDRGSTAGERLNRLHLVNGPASGEAWVGAGCCCGESTYSPGEALPGAPGESHTTIIAQTPGTAVVVFRLSPPNQQPDLKNIKRLTVVVR